MAYLNAMHNLLLRAQLPEGFASENYGIAAYSHPLVLPEKQKDIEAL